MTALTTVICSPVSRAEKRVFAQPRHGPSFNGLLAQLGLGVVVALILGGILHQRASHISFWTIPLASGIATFLFINVLAREVLGPPRALSDEVVRESSRLTDAITSPLQSVYAISSNWLALWGSPSFRYYLHLDTTLSLIALSEQHESPLARLSTDVADQRAFYDEGLTLLSDIAAQSPPLSKHRVRLLIYPHWVYTTYSAHILSLIRSHASGRVPCIPLVAESLYKRLSPQQREAMTNVSAGLAQNALDKTPPRAPVRQAVLYRMLGFESFRRRYGPVFPDILLIDSDLSSDTSAVYWYAGGGDINHWDNSSDAKVHCENLFRTFCHHARSCCWSEYVPAQLGGVATTVFSDRPASEAFFRRGFYDKWLAWIRQHRDTSRCARQLFEWLQAEEQLLREFALAPGLERPLELLDLGCGTGRHLLMLADKVTLKGVGVDVNELAISDARAKWNSVHSESDLDFVVADLASMSEIKTRRFDLAFCATNTLGNLSHEKQQATVRRLRSVVKPGGKVLISVYGRESVAARLESYEAVELVVQERGDLIIAAEGLSSECFSARKLRDLLEDNGLQVVDSHEVGTIGIATIATVP
jgi:SAM-dependent methyltransferase